MPLLEYWLDGADLFLCADGGGHPYTHLPRLPDAVIGDFDSLTGRLLIGRHGPRYLHVADQGTTDAEKALQYAADEGAKEAVLTGALGWRLDHTLFNVHLLERFSDRLRICLAGHQCDAVRIGPGERVAWELPAGLGFSLLPLQAPATGVSVANAEYCLENATVRTGGPALISNRVFEPPLRIAVGGGSLLVTVERHGWPSEEP